MYCLIKNPEKNTITAALVMGCAPRVFVCRPAAAVLDKCIVVEPSLLTARFPLCKPRPCRSLARGGACLRAQPSRLCIAALPLLPTKDTRIAGVCVPDAPRTTQLYYHAEALRLQVAARRYHSLRVSPASHPPERPAPLAASRREHASKHALPRRRGERRWYSLTKPYEPI